MEEFSSWTSPWLYSPGPIKYKAGTSAQVILNQRQALAGITRSHSLKRRCPGDEGLIGSVESPPWFCSASRAQDEIKKEGWLGARMAQRVFKKHLCPSERPQKSGSAWILIYLRGGYLPSVCVLSRCSLIPLYVLPCTPSYPTNSVSASHFGRPFFSSLSLSRRIYISSAPSSLPFVPSSTVLLILSPPGFSRV